MEKEYTLLSIYTGDLEKYNHRPLYEAIVYAAKKAGLSGATVFRGIMSFGPGSQIHSTKLFSLSSDLPIKIEIIDTKEKIGFFIEIVQKMLNKARSAGFISIQEITIIEAYKKKK
jgi:uncharacterized protein